MKDIIYISESTVSDDNLIYTPDLEHIEGKDYSKPILDSSWTTISKLVKQNYFITSIQPLEGNTIRWKIIVNHIEDLISEQ